MAADLVRRPVSAIAAFGIPPVKAATAATATIPIVFQGGFDPVATGFVASLSRPGGNVTGVTSLGVELEAKRAANRLGIPVTPTNPNGETVSRNLQAAARAVGFGPHLLHARTEADFPAVFATLDQVKADGLVVGTDGLFISRAHALGALTLSHRVPTIFQFREFAAAGGLMSYGDSITDAYRLAGGAAG